MTLAIEKHVKDVEQYVEDILTEKIPSCRWTRLAVERHVRDLEKGKYYYDLAAGSLVCTFIEELKHQKGKQAGKKIQLEPWQKFIIFSLFAWKNEQGLRRYTTAYVEVPRKNGKSLFAGAIGNYMLFADGEQGAECYSVATKKDQAKKSWDQAYYQVKSNKTLKRHLRSVHQINYKEGVFKCLSSDEKTEDGHNPHFAIIDEYHQHPNAGMYNAMKLGMGARTQPLLFIITTAGVNTNSVCYAEEERVKQVLDGTIEDDRYFGIIYTIDEDDEITDRTIWKKAHPNLGVSVSEEAIEEYVNTALTMPRSAPEIIAKTFNRWSNSTTQWITHEQWQSVIKDYDEKELEGRICYLGIDLSTIHDITALAIEFPPLKDGEKHRKLYKFYLPQDNILEKCYRDRVQYDVWAKQGYLTLTPGEIIDHDYLIRDIEELSKKYVIKEIGYDPHNSFHVVKTLTEKGFICVEFRQTATSMDTPIKEYERILYSDEMEVKDNPIMSWMIGNATIVEDSVGKLRITKPKRDSTGKKIDGVIADLMATDRARVNQESDRRKKRDITKSVRFIRLE